MSSTDPNRDRIVFRPENSTSEELLGSGTIASADEPTRSGWLARDKVITALVGAPVLAIIVGVATGAIATPPRGPEPTTSSTTAADDLATTPRTAPATTATSGQPSATDPPTTAPTAAPAPADTDWTVSKVIDGDTVDVSKAGTTMRIRVIGIDSPEIGQCGYLEATTNLKQLVAGKPVNVVPGARDDRDRYGRYLRYLDVNGTDAGLRQIEGGFAIARYDSRDGYGAHPREAAYIAADAASPAAPCSIPTPPSAPSKPANPAPRPSQPTTAWPLPGDQHPCPQAKPIKGNQSSMIAHSPGQQSYLVTNPEACFANLTDAAAAGYRPAKR